jgi:GTP-binding protein Era
MSRRCGTVAIVGRPNVGKSTLLNALVGSKLAITARRAQTTRQRVRGVLTEGDVQFIFVDTPGVQRVHRTALTRAMNRAVDAAVAGVDVILWLVDAAGIDPADAPVQAKLPGTIPVILVINKIDRLRHGHDLLLRLPAFAAVHDFAAVVPLSAARDRTFRPLLTEIARRLPEAPHQFAADALTDHGERFFAAEFIREKLFRLLGDELPHAAAVEIERYEELPNLRRIHAAILVQRDNHRGIVIGEGGKMLKRIGREARLDIERLTLCKVHLVLHVKVRGGWADNLGALRTLGYET